jgi:aminopeptidase N
VLRDYLFTILGSAHDERLAIRALEMALTDEPGATTSASIIRSVAVQHPELAFDFVVDHLDAVLGKVDSTSYGRYVADLLGHSSNVAYAAKLNSYADQHLAPQARRDSDAMIANIRLRAGIRTSVLPLVDGWLIARAH